MSAWLPSIGTSKLKPPSTGHPCVLSISFQSRCYGKGKNDIAQFARLKLYELALRNLEVDPCCVSEECGVLAPDGCSPVLESNVDVLLTFRLDYVVDAFTVHSDEIWFVVAEVGCVIGVLHREAEPSRQLGECGHLSRIFKEVSEVSLEFVVGSYKIEDRL